MSDVTLSLGAVNVPSTSNNTSVFCLLLVVDMVLLYRMCLLVSLLLLMVVVSGIRIIAVASFLVRYMTGRPRVIFSREKWIEYF
ncbi:hypothetical protein D3C80_1824410 [compost metagenome]